MKLNDIKHNHSLTDLLKILLFSILMMIPFIDVTVRCAYVICNKNAYQSYSGGDITELEPINDVYDINGNKYGNVLQFDNTNAYEPIDRTTFNYTYIEYLGGTLTTTEISYLENSTSFVLYYDSGTTRTLAINYTLNNTSNTYYILLPTYSFRFKVSDLNTISGTFSQYKQYIYYYNITTTGTLDNVFDYSVNKLSQSDLYTWTQQTAIYTGVQTMCTQLGINNTVIPLLLVYWFILTVIYIIIDIVLKLFTMLTHAIGSKTA